MTPRNLRNIHTIGNSCRDALPCSNMALKLPQYFYLLMEKPLGRYFQVRSPCYQAAQCNQKTLIPVSSRQQVRSEKAKKGYASTLITATTNVHLPKQVSTDLTINPDSVLSNPKCKAGRCKTFTPEGIFIVIPSLEGWPTKAKEAPSPHEVRLAPLDNNPVFENLGEI